jgi:hypothetical protein
MNRAFCFILAFAVTCVLVSCSIRRHVAFKNTIARLPDTIYSKKVDSNNIAKSIVNRTKIHFEGKESDQEFNINFRIRKDSIIWMAVTAMGGMVQAARVCVTKDSFLMINYIEKEAMCLPLEQVAKVLPVKVDYFTLQNLILGEPLRRGNIAAVNAGRFSGSWSLDISDTSYKQHITYSKDDTTMIEGLIETIDPQGPGALIKYSEYESYDQKKISTQREIKIQNGNDIYDIDMKFLNASFDSDLEYPFSIPKNYSKK